MRTLVCTLLCATMASSSLLGSSTLLNRLKRPRSPQASLDAQTITQESLLSEAVTAKEAAVQKTPFSKDELDRAVLSLQQLAPLATTDWAALRDLYAKAAHQTHKEWDSTAVAAQELAGILKGPEDPTFDRMFARVLEDGNFAGAASAASARAEADKPWVVLVTGLNGIRKTTSVGQPWFKKLLAEALGEQFEGAASELPDGNDSFFRQLDYMIATLALTEFQRLYTIDEVSAYAKVKDSIFARFRTVAEMLGVLLVREARTRKMNIMVETSGRDIGMYEYVDKFFPDDSYRKLVLNFEINDIGFAERSVDTRMLREMGDGAAALAASGDPMNVVQANAGGPYGSAVLSGVQADSRKVWQTIQKGGEGDVGHGWYKASIQINADAEKPWTAKAAVDGASVFEFGPPPGAAKSFSDDQRNPCVGEDGEACAF